MNKQKRQFTEIMFVIGSNEDIATLIGWHYDVSEYIYACVCVCVNALSN